MADPLKIDSPLTELHIAGVAGLSQAMAKKLAVAVASEAGRSDPRAATVGDLLDYLPMRYEDRSNLLPIDQLYDGLEASVELHTRVSGGYRVGKNRNPKAPPLFIFEISAGDAERTMKPVVVWWFLSGKQAERVVEYYQRRFARGVPFVAYGRWEWDARRNTFSLKLARPDELEMLPYAAGGLFDPAPEGSDDENDIEEAGDPEFDMVHTGRRVPVYRKLGPFRTKRLREIIFDVLRKLDGSSIEDTLPEATRKRNNLTSLGQAIEEVHFPPEGSRVSDYERFVSPAQRRLIFEDLFWLLFALRLIRADRKREPKGAVIELDSEFDQRVKQLLTFALTGAQNRVLEEIFADMASDAPMNRLIQGDVGSGKTIVAMLAIFAAVENGYQAALMAPTEILADQHARNAENVFRTTGYRTALLKGSFPAASKRKVQREIAAGEVQVVIGTHALIQEAVTFDNLGLVVIDEQHRFGVVQRSALTSMGSNPDVLVMTATPIPRSLAMTVYGDLDVSVIDEMPPGRTPVKTVVLGEDQRAGVYRGIEREVKRGRQVYVVYPLIEESEKMDLRAAEKMYDELRRTTFPRLKIGLLHGKMKAAEKDAIMTKFINGDLDILVSDDGDRGRG